MNYKVTVGTVVATFVSQTQAELWAWNAAKRLGKPAQVDRGKYVKNFGRTVWKRDNRFEVRWFFEDEAAVDA